MASSPASAPTPAPDHHHRALSSAVRAVSGMTMLSRVGGLLRDVMLAHVFGTSSINSCFLAGFQIPNLFRRLLGEGALSAAFIPEYTQATRQDPAQADRLASLTIVLLAAGAGALTIVIELVLLAILLLAPHDHERTLSFQLIGLMLPFMPFICVAAIMAGMLQVHGRFAPSASGPIILNTLIIVVGIRAIITGQLGQEGTAYLLGGATVLSGLTQCLWFLWLLRTNVRWRRDWAPARDAALRMARRFVPVLVGMGTLQINTFLDTFLTMWPIWIGPTLLGITYPMDDASNTILSLTSRIYQFPLGVFGVAVATAAFPLLSRYADEPGMFLQTLRRGLRLSLFIGMPASIGLIAVRYDVTYVLYAGRRTGFDAAALARSASVLIGYAPGVWAYSLNHVLTRAFYARHDTKTPMHIAIACVAFNMILNFVLIWPLHEGGLALATSISAAVQTGVLIVIAQRRLFPAGTGDGPILDRATVRAAVRITLTALVMGALVVAMTWAWPQPEGRVGYIVRLAAASILGTVAYGAMAFVLRVPELEWLLHRGRSAQGVQAAKVAAREGAEEDADEESRHPGNL